MEATEPTPTGPTVGALPSINGSAPGWVRIRDEVAAIIAAGPYTARDSYRLHYVLALALLHTDEVDEGITLMEHVINRAAVFGLPELAFKAASALAAYAHKHGYTAICRRALELLIAEAAGGDTEAEAWLLRVEQWIVTHPSLTA